MAKQITYDVTANTKQAEQGFVALDQKIARTATKTAPHYTQAMNRASTAHLNFNRVIQDSPYFFQSFSMGVMAVGNNIDPLVESMKRLKEETGSMKGAFKLLLTSLAGPSGIVTLISLAVSGLTAYTLWASRAKRETKAMAKDMASLKDVAIFGSDKKDKVKIPFALLPDYIKEAEKKVGSLRVALIKGLQLPISAAGTSFEAMIKSVKSGYKHIVDNERLQGTQLQENAKVKLAFIESMEKELNIYKDILKESKARYARLKAEEELYKKVLSLKRRADSLFPSGRGFDASGRPEGIKGGAPVGYRRTGRRKAPFDFLSPADLVKQYREVAILAEATAQTTYTAFSQAWEKIFGEANSLLEIFLQNIVDGIGNLASQYLFASVFNWLVPGSGALLFPGFGGTQTININLDGDVVASAVVNRYGKITQRAARLRT